MFNMFLNLEIAFYLMDTEIDDEYKKNLDLFFWVKRIFYSGKFGK